MLYMSLSYILSNKGVEFFHRNSNNAQSWNGGFKNRTSSEVQRLIWNSFTKKKSSSKAQQQPNAEPGKCCLGFPAFWRTLFLGAIDFLSFQIIKSEFNQKVLMLYLQ